MNEPTELQTFALAWGKQIFDRRQTQIHTFHYGTQGTTTFVNKVLSPAHRMQKDMASTDRYEGHGAWYRETLMSQNGIILLLKVQDHTHGAVRAQAAAFLELNENAPLLKITVPVCPHRLAKDSEMDAFVGRAYLLSPDEVKTRGYKLRPSFVEAFFDQEELDELLDVEELMGQRAEKPVVTTVVTSKGQRKKVLVPAEPKRKLRMRRK